MSDTGRTPAGWYADPMGRFPSRYWDGIRWTDHVAREGRTGYDPLYAAADPQGQHGQPPAGQQVDDPAGDAVAAAPAGPQPRVPSPGALPEGRTAADPPSGPTRPLAKRNHVAYTTYWALLWATRGLVGLGVAFVGIMVAWAFSKGDSNDSAAFQEAMYGGAAGVIFIGLGYLMRWLGNRFANLTFKAGDFLRIGVWHLRAGREERAEELFSRAIEEYPEYGMAHACRAASRAGRSGDEEVSEGFAEALELEPEAAPAHLMRGLWHVENKRFGEAIPDLQNAIELTNLVQARIDSPRKRSKAQWRAMDEMWKLASLSAAYTGLAAALEGAGYPGKAQEARGYAARMA